MISFLISLFNQGGSDVTKILSCGIKSWIILYSVSVKKQTFSSTITWDRALIQSNSLIALRISLGVAFLWNQRVFSYGGGYKIDKLNFAKTTWLWQFGCKDGLLIPWLNLVEGWKLSQCKKRTSYVYVQVLGLVDIVHNYSLQHQLWRLHGK